MTPATPSGHGAGHGRNRDRFIGLLYRFRWPAALLVTILTVGLMSQGWGRIAAFSTAVDSFADPPLENPDPRMFDPRADIWFNSMDDALQALRDIETEFVAQDVVSVSFEETEDPHGVFGVAALERIARVTAKLRQIPYVRNVRSLTENPWIRWDKVAEDEEGLIVSNLFEDPPAAYSEDERLYRMVMILGAERAAAIIGEKRARQLIGNNAKFADFIGEPRLVRSVVSEDGRTTAIQLQILRPRLTEPQLDEAFGHSPSAGRPAAPAIHNSTTQTRVLDQVDEVLATEEGIEWHMAGMPVLERHFPVVSKADMTYIGLMFGVIALVLLLVYRRITGVVIPLLVVSGSIMAMFGAVWLMGDLMNNLTAIAPNIMTAVGVADAVHLLTAYFVLKPYHDDKRALIHEVLRLNALPILLTSITTAIGFVSLTSSDVEPIRALGYTIGIGTAFAYLLSMTVVPALLSLLPVKPAKTRAREERIDLDAPGHWSSRLVAFTCKYSKTIVVLTILLFVIAGVGLSKIQLVTDMRTMFPSDDPVRRDLEWLGHKLGGAGDLEILFKGPALTGDPEEAAARLTRISELQIQEMSAEGSGESGTGNDSAGLSADERAELQRLLAEEQAYQQRRIAVSAEFLGQIDGLQRRIEEEGSKPGSSLGKVTSFDSGLSILRKIHQVQNKNNAAFYRVPAAADIPEEARQPLVLVDDILGAGGEAIIPAQTASSMAAQYYLQYENGAQPSESLASMINQDRNAFRVSARLDHGPTDVLQDAFEEIRAIARQEFPAIQGSAEEVEEGAALSTMTMTGRLYLYTNMFDRFVSTLIKSLSLALLTITILLVFVFRSVKLGAVSLVPNILPVVLPLGLIGLLGVPIDGPAVLVAAVALGVCVDDTIHFFTKYSQARKAGLDVEAALRRAFRLVGAALTATTLILVMGFSMLALSNLRPNIVIGYMGAIMIALAWVADFLLLPAFLRLLEKEPA